MIRQLGEATFFSSFSAAETQWKHLLRTLSYIIDGVTLTDDQIEKLTWEEKCRLIDKEPCMCLKHKLTPVGELIDFFYRVEFQQRGSPHIHMLLWIKDAPKFRTNFHDDITAFIDKNVSCRPPSQAIEPELYDLVQNQRHRHTHTCGKGKKFLCCFNFPKPPMPSTMILEPLQDISAQKKKELDKRYKLVQNMLRDTKAVEEMTYEEFIEQLDMSEDDYLEAIQ